jgi:hypothetical protein
LGVGAIGNRHTHVKTAVKRSDLSKEAPHSLWDCGEPLPREDPPLVTIPPTRTKTQARISESQIMTKWHYDTGLDEESDDPHAGPVGTRLRGKMPVGSEARAKAASKETWRSRRATKRVARMSSGIRNRRNKRID